MLRFESLALSLLGFHFQSSWAKQMPKDFLNKYCTQCHGEEKQKADRRFDMLSRSIGDFRELELWQEIVDQLNLGEMPLDVEKQPTEV